MVAKSLRHPKHRPQIFASRSGWPTALVGRPCDLIQVPADRPELGHRTLQRQQLLLGQRRQIAKVRPDEDGNVGGRRHSASSRPVAQQDPILGRQPDAEPGIPTHLLQSIELREPLLGRHAEHDLEELPDERGLRDLLTLREHPQERLHLRRHATLPQKEAQP